ncbi:hypothetical protein NL676_008272 [Syzygium grande]|nr:hypothetical protein NL676_008272 [Syzygium grande]
MAVDLAIAPDLGGGEGRGGHGEAVRPPPDLGGAGRPSPRCGGPPCRRPTLGDGEVDSHDHGGAAWPP